MSVHTDRANGADTARGPGAALTWLLGGSLLRPVITFLGAVVIVAGPWLVSIFALAIVSVTMTPVLGFEAVEDLRLTVVYAFCLAPLVAGPSGAIAARLIAAEVDSGEVRQAPALFLVAAIGSALLAEGFALGLVPLLGIAPFELAAAFVFLTGAAALLWTSFAALTALKAYRHLIWSFSGGMTVAVACIMLGTRGETDTELLIWSFTVGIAICVSLTVIRVRRTASGSDADLMQAVRDMLHAVRRLWVLGLGILLAVMGVWADKWVYWLSPEAMRSAAGFLHYSPYDSVMFVAHISTIPTFASVFLFHDSKLMSGVGAFRVSLTDRSTYENIRNSVEALGQTVWSGLFSIVFLQAALTTAMVLMAPALAKSLDFSFSQLLTLRVGLIAVFLHAVFYLCCAVILVCNRARLFLILQALFLLLNFAVSLGFYLQIGMSAYGLFSSALIMAVVAFFVAFRALMKFDYLAFLGENDALYKK